MFSIVTETQRCDDYLIGHRAPRTNKNLWPVLVRFEYYKTRLSTQSLRPATWTVTEEWSGSTGGSKLATTNYGANLNGSCKWRKVLAAFTELWFTEFSTISYSCIVSRKTTVLVGGSSMNRFETASRSTWVLCNRGKIGSVGMTHEGSRLCVTKRYPSNLFCSILTFNFLRRFLNDMHDA